VILYQLEALPTALLENRTLGLIIRRRNYEYIRHKPRKANFWRRQFA
jgi:hypothetical protein